MALNANDLFIDTLYRLREAPIQTSRNGMVRSLPTPTLWEVNNPRQRVLFHPGRKANPYFHVMEAVWMLGGAKDISWLQDFNKNIVSYAEDDGTINGAYGHRWRRHFGRDQLMGIIRELKGNTDSRQAVLAMYDPEQDYHSHWADRPCNTHIYFRVVNGCLDMTVCNRSNDVVWGMVGANIVHMTYMQEVVAQGVGVPLGRYYVLTNNLHIYQHHWHLLENGRHNYDLYHEEVGVHPEPMFSDKETSAWELLQECELFCKHQDDWTYRSSWLNDVVVPMYQHYMCRLNGDYYSYDLNEVKAADWRRACELWRQWHDN